MLLIVEKKGGEQQRKITSMVSKQSIFDFRKISKVVFMFNLGLL